MRRIATIFLTATLAVLATACSTMTVRADHDPQVDFASYTSFAMFELPDKERRGPQMSGLVDRRIVASLKTTLAGKGFTPAAPRDADFLVTYYTAVRNRVTVNGGGWYGCCGPFWGGGVTWINSYPEGTLVIDVIDRKSRELVWRGVGQGAFSKMNPSGEKVDKRITRILETFPPGG